LRPVSPRMHASPQTMWTVFTQRVCLKLGRQRVGIVSWTYVINRIPTRSNAAEFFFPAKRGLIALQTTCARAFKEVAWQVTWQVVTCQAEVDTESRTIHKSTWQTQLHKSGQVLFVLKTQVWDLSNIICFQDTSVGPWPIVKIMKSNAFIMTSFHYHNHLFPPLVVVL